jgi:carboxylesterase type B
MAANISLDGGFLQFGSPNSGSPVSLLSLQSARFIVIKPAYRLNIFGFLSSYDVARTSDSAGNFGFWDLRLALEWTYKNCSYFRGNPTAITVGGYSAGAHAAFHLLAYDLRQPNQLIRRVIMHSNGPGFQPKSLTETQIQFDELCAALDIPKSLTSAQKMARLRATSSSALLSTIKALSKSQFRAVSDDHFVSTSLLPSLRDGSFARVMRARNIPLFIGECADEHFIYARHKPPRPATHATVTKRLEADYPFKAVHALVKLSDASQWANADWNEGFGKLYAEVQIHMSQRGLIRSLNSGGVQILRYRIEWRAKCADKRFPKHFGATHGSDNYLWWYGDGDKQGLTEKEELIVKRVFLDDFCRFIKGEKVDWGLKDAQDVRRLNVNGEFDIWKDTLWEKELQTWDIVSKASEIIDRAKI